MSLELQVLLHAVQNLIEDGDHSLQTTLILIWPLGIPILSLQVQGLTKLQLSTGFPNIQPEKESRDPPAKYLQPP